MKNLNEKITVEAAIEEIQKIAPKHSEVSVDMEKSKKGIFCTNIKLVTKKKVYFAKKEDNLLNKSFYKAMRAIKAQVKKNKVNHHTEKYSLVA